jgi:hypothetical protein
MQAVGLICEPVDLYGLNADFHTDTHFGDVSMSHMSNNMVDFLAYWEYRP